MASKVEKKRADLKKRLTDIAQKRIQNGGIDQIKARELAREAECAVGAIYNVFGDLNELIMAVNGRTFRQLGEHVAAALDATPKDSPVEEMITMAHAYLDFAIANTQAWKTLFDLEMSTENDVPDWYMSELENLLMLIARPLSQTRPDISQQDIMLMTRGLFSSVHGIVLLGLQKRISAVPVEELKRMISLILNSLSR